MHYYSTQSYFYTSNTRTKIGFYGFWHWSYYFFYTIWNFKNSIYFFKILFSDLQWPLSGGWNRIRKIWLQIRIQHKKMNILNIFEKFSFKCHLSMSPVQVLLRVCKIILLFWWKKVTVKNILFCNHGYSFCTWIDRKLFFIARKKHIFGYIYRTRQSILMKLAKGAVPAKALPPQKKIFEKK